MLEEHQAGSAAVVGDVFLPALELILEVAYVVGNLGVVKADGGRRIVHAELLTDFLAYTL
jgi:hypothetical protein